MEIRAIEVERGYAFFSARAEERDYRAARERFVDEIAESGIPIELLQFATGRVGFVCSAAHAQAVFSVAQACAFTANVASPCAKLAIAGEDMSRTSGVMAAIVRALRERKVDLLHFADGGTRISLVIREHQSSDAEKALRELLSPAARHRPIGAFSFDEMRGIVRVDGRIVRLGARQASLLRYLIANGGEVVTAERIAHDVFSGSEKDIAAVRVHVHYLRKKLERDPYAPRYVVTVPNQGYVFAE
jgi:Transcriptional regulatory protein, C terminal